MFQWLVAGKRVIEVELLASRSMISAFGKRVVPAETHLNEIKNRFIVL